MVATDLDGAKALLAEAGVTTLELSLTCGAGDTIQSLAAELWRANLATLGVTLTVQPMTWEAQWQLAKADPAAAQDIFVMYWWPTFVTPFDFLFNLFYSEESPNFNLGYYSNPAFDALLDAANVLSASDRAASEAGFRDAQRLVIDDAAAVFMMDTPNVHVIRSDISGFVDNPAYGHITFVHQLRRQE